MRGQFMRSRTYQFLLASTLSLMVSGVCANGAVVKEVNGQVVVEAEHFDFRTNQVNGPHHWAIIPDEEAGAPPFQNARGSYLQNLPDAGVNNNSDPLVGIPPYVDYKVQIATPGQYQLYLRHTGWDGSSDSGYAQILELMTSVGGPGPDWYRYSPNPTTPDFAALQNDPNDATTTNQGWSGYAAPIISTSGDGGEEAALWTISAAGTYTIRFSQREDGTAIDALILQLATLPAPTNPGPAESDLASGIIIATQPRDVTVGSGQTATFTVVVKSGVPSTYQWQKASPGSTNFTDIIGATGTSYTTPAATVADDGTRYRVTASITGQSVTSRGARLTVDVTPPSVVRASGSSTFDKVRVVFSEPVDPASAANTAHYSLNGGLTISGATLAPGGTTVILTTSKQTTNAAYTVTVTNVTDVVGNVLSPNPSTANFTGWVLSSGVLHKFFANVTGNTIANLTNDARFPDNPTFITVEPLFEYPPNGGNEAGDNYGNQLSGVLTAPTNGNYVFFTCSDDPSELYLSTDENRANRKLIAVETVWSNARQWIDTDPTSTTDLPSKRSDQFPGSQWPTPNVITLTAGNRYYIEVLHTEGGGGDNVGVNWMLPGAVAEPQYGEPPISGTNISFYYNPDGKVTITQQPQSASVPANSPVTFSVVAVSLKKK